MLSLLVFLVSLAGIHSRDRSSCGKGGTLAAVVAMIPGSLGLLLLLGVTSPGAAGDTFPRPSGRGWLGGAGVSHGTGSGALARPMEEAESEGQVRPTEAGLERTPAPQRLGWRLLLELAHSVSGGGGPGRRVVEAVCVVLHARPLWLQAQLELEGALFPWESHSPYS